MFNVLLKRWKKFKKNLEKSFNRVYDEIKEHISNTEIMEHMDAIKEILER